MEITRDVCHHGTLIGACNVAQICYFQKLLRSHQLQLVSLRITSLPECRDVALQCRRQAGCFGGGRSDMIYMSIPQEAGGETCGDVLCQVCHNPANLAGDSESGHI